jgi:predicted dehydrogenase
MNSKSGKAALNFGLIGCGRISQAHLQALGSIPECKLKGVSDLRRAASDSVADQYGCKAYTKYQHLLDGNPIDAVVICTPPDTHAEIATFFLENGVHVLCEKPLALNARDAAGMVQKADQNGSLLMMASKFRYVDDIIKAKGIVESGILGDIMLFENVFCSKVSMQDRWNAKKEIAGGGVLVDNGSHSVDIARYLLGPIVKVQAEEGKRVQKLQVEDTTRLYFRTQSDIMGAVDLSWSIHKEQESYIDIYGTEGVLSIGWKCSKYRQSEKLEWVHFGSGYNKIAAFARQISNFIGTVKGREMPLINGQDGLESVKVIEAAYKSASMNKWVEVGS